MKIEHQYLWRTKWNGRWSTTRFHCTEETIRKNHPDAQRIDSSLRVVEIPETPEEIAQRSRDVSIPDMSSLLPRNQKP